MNLEDYIFCIVSYWAPGEIPESSLDSHGVPHKEIDVCRKDVPNLNNAITLTVLCFSTTGSLWTKLIVIVKVMGNLQTSAHPILFEPVRRLRRN